MGEIRILCHLGDDKISWDPKDDKSTDFAEKEFNRYIKEGYKAYRLDEKGKKSGWPITEFPPHASKLLFIPKVVGG